MLLKRKFFRFLCYRFWCDYACSKPVRDFYPIARQLRKDIAFSQTFNDANTDRVVRHLCKEIKVEIVKQYLENKDKEVRNFGIKTSPQKCR